MMVPSHVGIGGYDQSDLAVKSALNLPHAKLGIPYTDPEFHIDNYITYIRQHDWNNVGVNILFSVKPYLGLFPIVNEEEIILCTMCTRHAYIIHKHIEICSM